MSVNRVLQLVAAGKLTYPLSRRARGVAKIAAPLIVGLAAVAFSAAPAFAAEETPTTEPATGGTATTAVLHGVLNPDAPGEAGSYEFSYEPSSAVAPECNTGATLAPASPVADAGAQGEAETLTVKGLEPSREYAFCIVAYSLAGGLAEPAFGVAVPFTTLPEAPAVDIETATVTSTAATLEAQVNANNQETMYSFEYATKGKTGAGEKLEGTVTKLEPPAGTVLAAVFGDQQATVPQITGLAPGTTYFYRVLTENAAHEKTDGKVEPFTTVPTPHTDAVTAVTATTATFNGHLTLDSGETKFAFAYNPSSEGCTGLTTEPAEKASTGTVSMPVTNLQPNATYTVCLVTSNAFGSESRPNHSAQNLQNACGEAERGR